MDSKIIKISASDGSGWLYIISSFAPEGNFEEIKKIDVNSYKLKAEKSTK